MLNEKDVALVEGMTLDKAKLTVSAVQQQRLELAAVLLSKQGVPATPEFVKELGEYWSIVFQVQPGRGCFFCGQTQAAKLCGCYPAIPVPVTREDVAALAEAYPDRWPRIKAERCVCGCGAEFDVPLGVIADRLRQGRLWSTPKACRDCWNAAKRPRPKWAEPPSPKRGSSSVDLLLREIEMRFVDEEV